MPTPARGGPPIMRGLPERHSHSPPRGTTGIGAPCEQPSPCWAQMGQRGVRGPDGAHSTVGQTAETVRGWPQRRGGRTGPALQAAATAACRRGRCVRVKGETGPASQRQEWRHEGPESGERTGASWLRRGLAEGRHRRPGQAEAGSRGFEPGLNLGVRSQSCWMWGGGRGRMGWAAPHPRVEPRSGPVEGPGQRGSAHSARTS